MSYQIEKLKNIALIKTGKLDSNAAVADGVYPFFTCDPNTLKIDDWAYDTEAVLLAGNNASGNYTAKYYKGKFNAYQRTYIIESANTSLLSVRFLAFAITEQLRLLKSMSSGSTTKFLTIKILNDLDIPCPEITIQRKIASIIGSYDNLIENNQKQIKLLEEATQRIYKEWFIDLRFPGYENVEIVDGVPEGWNIGILGDIGIFKRGKTITKAKIAEGEVPVISGGLGPAYYHNESNTSTPVITVSGSGANAGFTRLYYTKVFASDCSFVDIEQTPYLYWIYLFLKNNSSRLDMLQKGSAQPHVYAKDINGLECIIPMKEILNLFCEVVSSYFDKIGILDKQIIRLTEARDRLLPKIMSGEIEV